MAGRLARQEVCSWNEVKFRFFASSYDSPTFAITEYYGCYNGQKLPTQLVGFYFDEKWGSCVELKTGFGVTQTETEET